MRSPCKTFPLCFPFEQMKRRIVEMSSSTYFCLTRKRTTRCIVDTLKVPWGLYRLKVPAEVSRGPARLRPQAVCTRRSHLLNPAIGRHTCEDSLGYEKKKTCITHVARQTFLNLTFLKRKNVIKYSTAKFLIAIKRKSLILHLVFPGDANEQINKRRRKQRSHGHILKPYTWKLRTIFRL